MFGVKQLLFLRILTSVPASSKCPPESLDLACVSVGSAAISSNEHKISEAIRWEIPKSEACKEHISTRCYIGKDTTTPSFGDLRNSMRGHGFFDKMSFSNKEADGLIIVQMFGDNQQLIKEDECPVLVMSEDPVPKIVGGAQRILEAHKDAEVDGSESVDKNSPFRPTDTLTYQWDCELKEKIGLQQGFCLSGQSDRKYQGPIFIIPKHFAADKAVFYMTLKVRSTLDPDGAEVSAKQTVTFLEKLTVISIECIENCPNLNPSRPTTLKVVCQKNCENVAYKWVVFTERQRGKIMKAIVEGHGSKFIAPANKLSRGYTYTFRVETKGTDRPGLAELEIAIPPTPILLNCEIDPKEGKAQETEFMLLCDWRPISAQETLVAKIYALNNKNEKILVKSLPGSPDLDTAVFMLPETTQVEVLLQDLHGGEERSTVSVIVKDTRKLKMEELLANTEKETTAAKVFEALDHMSTKLKDFPIEEVADYGLRAVSLLDKVLQRKPTEEQVIRASELINELTKHFGNKPPPDMASKATDFCKQSAQIVLDKVTESKNQEEFREKAERNSRALANCSTLGLKNNTEAVNPKNVTDPYKEFNMAQHIGDFSRNETSNFDLENWPKPDKHYDDYGDDDNVTDALTKFERASENLIQICLLNAKTLAMTLSHADDQLKTEVADIAVLAKRKYGKDLIGGFLTGKNVTLRHSNDFLKEPERIIDVLMCVTDHNPLWWAREKIASQVAIIQYQKRIPKNSALENTANYDEIEIKSFEKPFRLIFKINESTHLEEVLDSHEALLPKESIEVLNEHTFYDKVSVFRISVPASQSFKVEFQNLTEHNILNVLVTNFQKASFAKFKSNSIKVSMENPSININHNFPYNSFYFLSVLPNQKMKQSSEKYVFAAYTFACFSWKLESRKWEFACQATRSSNTTHLECVCNVGGGTLAGLLINNKVSFVTNVIISFKLPFTICYIIFIATTVIFGLYCIFLSFAVFEAKEEILDRVYFLSDVPSFYKYGYLIIIKTGNKNNAGTTSNVSIKLNGEKVESTEHVLNYPDKYGKILSRNQEDWFIMGTENHLGDLATVEFWFDSIGESPTWYCSYIQIYDIQKEKMYFFLVQKWLNITKDNNSSYVVSPMPEEEFFQNEIVVVEGEHKRSQRNKKIEKVLTNFYNVLYSRSSHMWNIWKKEDILLKAEKVTLSFSVILSMFALELFLYNCPNFDNSDSIDPNTFGADYQLIWIPLLGSFVTFICHFPLIYVIKKEKATLTFKKDLKYPVKLQGCWILIIFNITLCITLLVVFGFWVPWNTSYLWLVSVILSTLFYVFVLENISCLIYGNVLKIHSYVETFTEKVIKALKYAELQRQWIYKRFGNLALRPYLDHLYKRLDEFELKDRKSWEEVKTRTLEILEDLIMIIVYVALLYTIILIDKEEYTVNSHLQVKTLTKGRRRFENHYTIDRVHSLYRLKIFLSHHVVYYLQDKDVAGSTRDLSNHYLGVIRLRQHRATSDRCAYPIQMHFLNITCRHIFADSPESRDFGETWGQSDLKEAAEKRLGKSWTYTKADIAGTGPYLGRLALYPGGGFIAPLGRTQKNSLINLRYLIEKKWFDLLTRALFVECLLYNQNSNIFNAIQLVFEISGTGHISHKIEIQTRKLLFLTSEINSLKKVVYLSFLIVLIIIAVKFVTRIFMKKKLILTDLWSLVDMVILLLSFGVIYLYMHRMIQANLFLKNMSSSRYNEFVNYFHLFQADNILYSFTAGLVFIATLRLWKLMRFLLMIKIAERTLKKSAVPLLTMGLYQGIGIMAFGTCGMMLFGEKSDDFKSIPDTITTLLLLSVNLIEKEDVEVIESSGSLGMIYYSLYMIFSLFVVTLYIAIVTIYYMEANEFYSNERGDFQKYLKLKIGYYYTLVKVKIKNLRGGQENESENKILPPKDNQYRYARCLTIPEDTLKLMALMTKCVLKNQSLKTSGRLKTDFELMRQVVVNLSKKPSSKEELFFISSATKSEVGLVDDKKLLEIDDILEKLIQHRLASKGQGRKTIFDQRAERIDAMRKNMDVLIKLLEDVSIVFD